MRGPRFKGHVCQRAAALKGPVEIRCWADDHIDLGQACGNVDLLQRGAVAEGKGLHFRQGGRQRYAGQRSAVGKRSGIDRLQALGENDLLQVGTVGKSSLANGLQILRQRDLGQRRRFRKRIVPLNGNQRIRKIDGSQLLALAEGPAADAGNSIGDRDGAQTRTVIE